MYIICGVDICCLRLLIQSRYKSKASATSLHNRLCLQIPCTCSLITPNIYSPSNQRRIWNPVGHLWWSLFAEIVNVLRPLAIFAEELNCGCLTGCLTEFKMRLCHQIPYYSLKKVLGEVCLH